MIKRKLASTILLIAISVGIACTNFTSAKAMISDSSDYSDYSDNDETLPYYKNYPKKDKYLDKEYEKKYGHIYQKNRSYAFFGLMSAVHHVRNFPLDLLPILFSKYGPCHITVLKKLGEGGYNIAVEIHIYAEDNKSYVEPKVLRLKQSGEGKGALGLDFPENKNLSKIEFEESNNLPQIELKGNGWLITPKYHNFKYLLQDIEKKDFNEKKALTDCLICCYAKSMYNLMKHVHSKGFGVFDWKISNFCFSLKDDQFRLIFCDIDFTELDRCGYSYTHNIYFLNCNTSCANKELDIKIAIKDIHDLIKTIGSGNTVKSYEDFFKSNEDWGQILSDLNEINHPANKWINLMLETINKQMISESNTDVESLEFTPFIKSWIEETRNYIPKEEIGKRNTTKESRVPIENLIEIPFKRILPPPILFK